jgi:glycosyltransferase involved in cell wall biosynthesis
MPKYSICMTCFNEVGTTRDSLNSLFQQLDKDYEVVVVDNFSTDGTYEVLKEFEQDRGLKAIQKRSSRGQGRQCAFEHASGNYVIANLDLDDIFLPVLGDILKLYHEGAEGKLLAVFNSTSHGEANPGWVQNITIGPRDLIMSLGGWRDLNLFEDWDIWSRAERVQKYCWTTFRFAANETVHLESGRAATRLAQRYEKYRDRLLLGLKVFSRGEKIGLSQRIAYVTARISMLSRSVLIGQDPEFNSLNPDYYVTPATGALTQP